MKTCKQCNIQKPLDDFHKSHVTRAGTQIYKARCKPCAKEFEASYYQNKDSEWKDRRRKKNREKFDGRWHKNYRLETKYNISIDIFEEMYDNQSGKCGICSTPVPDDEIRVDHCHTTGKVRALLCHNCNTGLGHFKDSEELLERARKYLETNR